MEMIRHREQRQKQQQLQKRQQKQQQLQKRQQKLQRNSRKRHSLWENIKHSGFLSTIMTLIVQNIKRERQQISVPTLQVLSKKERVLE